MSYVTYATCDLAILQKPGLTSRIPLHCNYHTEVTSKNGLLHMTAKYICWHKKCVIFDGISRRIETAISSFNRTKQIYIVICSYTEIYFFLIYYLIC